MDERPFTIRLRSSDIGQILDALRARAAIWRDTHSYLQADQPDDFDRPIEECSNPAEAASLAARYDEIIDGIEGQLRRQGW